MCQSDMSKYVSVLMHKNEKKIQGDYICDTHEKMLSFVYKEFKKINKKNINHLSK